MSGESLTISHLMVRNAALRAAAPPLLLGLVVLGLLFRVEIVNAVQVWEQSTAYSHCYFVLPIALYLAWDRRHLLPGIPIVPLPWLALLALPLGLAWLAADRLGIMEGRQLVAMTFVQLLFLVVLGWRLYWALSAALLYLYFMVPFGAFLTPVLQKFTAEFSFVGLTVLGIPYYADDFLIEIPEGRFYVAEACAGLRFLIASIAFGVLYACLIYRSFTRRFLFMLASIIIPIVANGFRALGIVVLGHILGSAEAAGADHILYGWVFFSIVILLLILAGMPFRQDTTPPPASEPPPATPIAPGLWRAALAGAAGIVILASGGAATGAWLDGRSGDVAGLLAPALVNAAGCVAAGPAATLPPDRTGQRAVQEFRCGRVGLTVTTHVFPPRANPNLIVTQRRALGQEESTGEVETGSLAVPDATPANWRMSIGNDPAVMAISALWIEGQPGRGGLAERILQARNSILGAPAAPVLVAIAFKFDRSPLPASDRDRGQKLLRAFLQAQKTLSSEIGTIAAAAVAKAGG